MLYKYTVLPQNCAYSKIFSVKPEPLTTLWIMLHEVQDFRRPQGKRHSLSIILTLAIMALCCGHVSFEAMSEWCVNYQEMLVSYVPFLAHHTPVASTFHEVFKKLDSTSFEEVINTWLSAIIPLEIGEGIALDGKEIHGTGLCLVSAFAHVASSVLFQMGTDTKGKELVIGPKVLKHITVKDHVITGDALFAQKKLCEQIGKDNGGYVFRVKGNQERLEQDIRLYFADLPFKAATQTYKTVDRWKGQKEVRIVTVSSELNGYVNWPGLTHVWQMVKSVTKKDKQGEQKTTTEVSVGIARITVEVIGKRTQSQAVAQYIRGHWGIETRLHRTRDRIFNEDKGTIRRGNAPHIMATLRNLVISIFHRATVRSFPKTQRRFASHPDELFAFLGLSQVALV